MPFIFWHYQKGALCLILSSIKVWKCLSSSITPATWCHIDSTNWVKELSNYPVVHDYSPDKSSFFLSFQNSVNGNRTSPHCTRTAVLISVTVMNSSKVTLTFISLHLCQRQRWGNRKRKTKGWKSFNKEASTRLSSHFMPVEILKISYHWRQLMNTKPNSFDPRWQVDRSGKTNLVFLCCRA